MNVDVVVRKGLDTGLGVVIGDEKGEVMGSCCRFFPTVFSVEIVECLGREGRY